MEPALRLRGAGAGPELGGLLAQLRKLTESDRRSLSKMSVRLGVQTVYCAAMLGPAAIRTRSQLHEIATGTALPAPVNGRSSFPYDGTEDLAAIGYRALGELAVRVDTVEKVASWARDRRRESDVVSFDLPMSWMGCKRPQVPPVIRGLGFSIDESAEGKFAIHRQKRNRSRGR